MTDFYVIKCKKQATVNYGYKVDTKTMSETVVHMANTTKRKA